MHCVTTELSDDHSWIILTEGGNMPCQSVQKMWAEKEMILVSRQFRMRWVKESSELKVQEKHILMHSVTHTTLPLPNLWCSRYGPAHDFFFLTESYFLCFTQHKHSLTSNNALDGPLSIQSPWKPALFIFYRVLWIYNKEIGKQLW